MMKVEIDVEIYEALEKLILERRIREEETNDWPFVDMY
jgi:hypothetical protein